MKPAYEMYKIRTTKAPSKGDKYGFFAQDEVEYEVHVENTGNIVLTFVIDTRNLKGKELVAFETAYRINDYEEGKDLSETTLTQVAEHKDINDEGQTVHLKDGPEVSPPPKTGDNTMLWLYGGLFTAAFGSMLIVAELFDLDNPLLH